jgi:N-methylhydantoinase B
VIVNPGRVDERHILKANGLKVRKGDVVRCAVGGGGGFGDPVDRAVEDIRADILDGYVTADAARQRYGYDG